MWWLKYYNGVTPKYPAKVLHVVALTSQNGVYLYDSPWPLVASYTRIDNKTVNRPTKTGQWEKVAFNLHVINHSTTQKLQ